MELKGKKALVIGTGLSGIAAAELLLQKGADIVLYDGNEKLCEADIRAKSEKLQQVPIIIGVLKQEIMGQFALAVLSPGVPTDLPVVKQLAGHGVKLWGEVELAYRCARGRLAAITGTNGKTTTTALAGEILKSHYNDVYVVGNIGIPYTRVAAKMTDGSVTAAEISSFQLETLDQFHPQVSAILNITPDHLNRHHTMECYTAVKESVTKNQTPGDTCVLNYEDEALRAFGESVGKDIHVVYFSSKRKLGHGLYLEDGSIFVSDKQGIQKEDGNVSGKQGIQKLVDVGELNLLGVHNYENVMAASAVCLALGVPLEKIRNVLKTFKAVAHRIEYVDTIGGVCYYNDSKATNTDAAIQGIRAMERATYLIGGGYDKQAQYGDWIGAFDGKVRKLVLIGQTKEKIARDAAKKGFFDTVMCETFEEAVHYCHSHAKSGEAVLLSPACASWDMFPNYERRGDIFKELVRGYKEKG